MINQFELNKAYAEDRFYSLQLEIGDKCYQECIYCYMNAIKESINQLDDKIIFNIINQASDLKISAIEWLGGEPLLRKSVFKFLELSLKLELRNNMWTGGLPLTNKNTLTQVSELCRNGLISFHLSTINPDIYKKLHPNRPVSDLKTIIENVENLLRIGYPSNQLLNSLTYTGMQPPEDLIATMYFFKDNYSISSSLNIYHSYLRPGLEKSYLKLFIPKMIDIRNVMQEYSKINDVERMPMNCVNKQYCSTTIAVLNDGCVTPCATIRETLFNIKEESLPDIIMKNKNYFIFKHLKTEERLHPDCERCDMKNQCWGCRSRAFSEYGSMYDKDPRCDKTTANISFN